MDGTSAAGVVVGFAVPVFQCAKALRDKIKQVASEKVELLVLLSEYEKDINLLESLYNDHKDILDQHHLDIDLRELAGIIHDLDTWLNSVSTDLSKKELPSIKELWRVGDLREKMAAANVAIDKIRNRWEVRLNVSSLVSITAIYDGQTEMRTTLHQIISMLRQQAVQQCALTLSMHSQVEPVGFNSQTTRVITNENASGITFSILSPDASLSYDRIKLRLEEYRLLLASNSDTVELPTENGKIVICRKEATGMGQFLDQAETLLRDIIQLKDVSTLVVLHRLRDLAKVLDDLKLHDECRLTGNFALDLAETLGRQSLEFRHDQAETIAVIAGLSVYSPRARTLFTQAVSICDEVVASHASDPNNNRLLVVLHRAGHGLKKDPELSVQWLERAVQLMTKELPSTLVTATFRSVIYFNYGVDLRKLERYADAVEAQSEAVSIRRELAIGDPLTHTSYLVRALENIGMSLDDLRRYDDAAAAYKEALEQWNTAPPPSSLQYNARRAKMLYNYGITLWKLSQFSEAAEANKEAVLLYRELAEMESHYSVELIDALSNYGESCHLLGHHGDAVRVYQEYIPLQHSLVEKNPEEAIYLCIALHNMANSLHALDEHVEAHAAATEAVQINQERVLEACRYAPDFTSCFVCQRANTPDPRAAEGDNSPSLLPFPPPSTEPRGNSEAGTSPIPTRNPAEFPSAHIPPINVPKSLELGRHGAERNLITLEDSPVPSPSYQPPGYPEHQVSTDSNTLLPNFSKGTVKGLWNITREKFRRWFRNNRAEPDSGADL